MRNTNPQESLEAEGIPEVEDRPPGIDVELDQDSMMPPRDHPIAVGDDPAYPVTAAEERIPEGVVDRARRENPDVGADELGVGGSVQGSAAVQDLPAPGTGIPADPGSTLSPEEDAVHVRTDDDRP